MKTEMGEYIVGAYLQIIKKCDVVSYNVRPPGGKLKGLEEFDVIGFDFGNKKAYLCEVSTHTRGMRSDKKTLERIKDKHKKQKDYAQKHLKKKLDLEEFEYMLWSPYVPIGKITETLGKLKSLELVINGKYKERIEELQTIAKKEKHDTGNPFFRVLQIMDSMNDRQI